jgi:hypothetical protein
MIAISDEATGELKGRRIPRVKKNVDGEFQQISEMRARLASFPLVGVIHYLGAGLQGSSQFQELKYCSGARMVKPSALCSAYRPNSFLKPVTILN